MSTTIDQRVVQMQFDNKQFESSVKTSMATIDKLKQSLDFSGASKGLENISASVGKCNMSGLSGAVQAVHAKFSALEVMAVTALANIANSAISAGASLVSSLTVEPIKLGLDEYETKMNAITTILTNTKSKGTTLDDVNASLGELNEYADLTIYNFAEMTRNVGTFTAAGVGLETSVGAIKGIANLAAGSGSNAQQATTAMYQLSQALAEDRMSLQSWNSVVNAGMGGEMFQHALIEKAVEMGKLNVDKANMIKDGTIAFREAMKGTATTAPMLNIDKDIMVSVFNDFANNEDLIKAATQVKTFTQLFDTMKESVQSGWAISWETIIGDREEAITMLTSIKDAFDGVMGAAADARNELLSDGLSSGWKQFVKEGIPKESDFKDTIKSVAKEHGKDIDEMIKKEGSFEATLKSGWLTADILSGSLTKLTEKTKGLSDEQLAEMGYTRKQVEELEKLNEKVKNGTVSIDDFVKKMAMASGRENLIQALSNAFAGLASIVKPITEAFKEIFPPYTGEQLYALTEKIKNITAEFKISDTTSEDLKSTFKGLFAVLDIVGQAFSAVFTAISPLVGSFTSLGGGILGVTATWGDWLVSLNETIKTTGIFNTAVQGITGFIDTAVVSVKGFITTVKEKFELPGFEFVHTFLEKVHQTMANVVLGARSMNLGFSGSIKAMGDSVANSKFMQTMESWRTGITTVAKNITATLSTIVSGIIQSIGNIDFNKVLDVINTLISGGLGAGLIMLVKNIADAFKEFGSVTVGIADIFDGVRGSLEAYQNKLNSDTLLKIASAVGILAAALYAVSTIDSEKLKTALGAITVLFADLVGSMAIFGKISETLTGVSKTCLAMESIAVAVLILANALKQVGELNVGQMTTGLKGVTGLMGALIAATKIMGNGGAILNKGAEQLVIFAAAIKLLASACIDLSVLNGEALTTGLVGVGVLMGEIAGFTKLIGNPQNLSAVGFAMIEIGAAMKIFASALIDMSALTWDKLLVGLGAMGGVLAEVGVAVKLMPPNMISIGLGLDAIGVAMNLLATALIAMSSLTWDTLKVGLTAMGIALLEVAVAVKIMPKNMIGVGLGLDAVAVALVVMADAMKKFGGLTWDEIKQGLTALGGSLGILAVGLFAMKGSLAGSAALLVAATALLVLTPALSILGAMSWEGIVKGLVALAGAFAIIGVAGLVLAPIIPAILGLGAAFALIGVGVLAIGAGLLAAGAGLAAFAVGITALAASGAAGATAVVASLSIIITGVASLIPEVIAKIGEGIVEFCKVITNGMPAIMETFMAITKGILEVLLKSVPEIVDVGLKLLLGLLEGIAKNIQQVIKTALEVVTEFLKGVTKGLPGVIKAGVDLIVAFMKAIGEETPKLIDAGFKMIIDFINGLAEAIRENMPVLIEAIVNLAGAIIEGLVGGLTSGVQTVVAAIVDLGKALWDGFKKLLGIESPSKVFLEMAGDIIKGLVNGLKNGLTSIGNVANDMSTRIFNGIKELPNKIGGIARDIISGLANGLRNGLNKVSQAAKDVANTALNSAKSLLGINSPSYEFEMVGEYSGKGFVNGLIGMAKKVGIASKNVGKTALDSMKGAMAMVANSLSGEIDNTLTIRPIVDMDGVNKGIKSAFDKEQRINVLDIKGKTSSVSSSMHANNNAGSGSAQTDNTDNSQIQIINNFNVRSDNDVHKISRDLNTIMERFSKAKGVAVT